MILILLLGYLNFSNADPTWRWTNATNIVEKHEFYTNNEVIVKPKNSWQVLFAVVYKDSNLKTFKDCMFYRVPGDDLGVLKLKTTTVDKPCEDLLFGAGNEEWKDLKALQYSVEEKLLTVNITNSQFLIESWVVPLFNNFKNPAPKPLMSSAEYRSPKIMYLTPYKGSEVLRPEKSAGLKAKTLCHEISEDCKEKAPSTCSQCETGWYEIPNGCPAGPKYCGELSCGKKGQHACRRGVTYQRVEKNYNCREDSSFAYCAKGLAIQCQGNLPYCL